MAALGTASIVRDAARYPSLGVCARRCFQNARVATRHAQHDHADDRKFSGTIVLKGPRFGPKRMEEREGLISESVHTARTLDLDRTEHGNALTPQLMRALRGKLKMSNRDIDATRVIVLRPKPTEIDMRAARRAYPRQDFCVGDDRMVNIVGPYVREQYELLNDLHCSRPVVACLEGLAQDAGAALALNCFFRVATSTTNVVVHGHQARPCMHGGIVGVLSKLDFSLGNYLALTGAPLRAADAFHAGLATVYVPHERFRMLQDRLMYLRHTTLDTIAAALNEHAAVPEPFTLEPHLDIIDKCFAKNTVEDIRMALEKEDSDFARGALKAMDQKSPLALKLTLRQMLIGATMDEQECLRMGFRVWSHANANKDKRVGGSTLESITDEMVDAHFDPLPEIQELYVSPALPWEQRMEQKVLTLDDVAITRVLESFGPETLANYQELLKEGEGDELDSGDHTAKPESAAMAPVVAAELSAVKQVLNKAPTLPPYGPLLFTEVEEAASEIESADYSDLARRLHWRLSVPGNAERLQRYVDILPPPELTTATEE